MNCLGKIAFCLASGAAVTGLCVGPAPSSPAPSGNPYEPIVVRNVFDLNPPQPVIQAPPDTPVKITPDGIMTIFGSKQVLFYADIPPRPPIPATQKSYILSEGQQQDDIEVRHIDEKKGIISFSNHGVLQELPLAKAGPITTPTPVVMNTAPPAGVPANNYGRAPAGNNGNLASRFGQNRNFGSAARNFGNAGNTAANTGNPGFGTSIGAGNTSSRQPLSSEDQALLIAAQHAHAQQTGDPIAPIFPPTEFDSAAGVK